MISVLERKALLELCERFINSGKDVMLVHLMDLVNSTIKDHGSKECGKTGGFSLGKTLRVGTYDIEFRVLKIKIGNRYDV